MMKTWKFQNWVKPKLRVRIGGGKFVPKHVIDMLRNPNSGYNYQGSDEFTYGDAYEFAAQGPMQHDFVCQTLGLAVSACHIPDFLEKHPGLFGELLTSMVPAFWPIKLAKTGESVYKFAAEEGSPPAPGGGAWQPPAKDQATPEKKLLPWEGWTGQKSPESSFNYHYNRHGKPAGVSGKQYARDAREWARTVDRKSGKDYKLKDGTIGQRYRGRDGRGGILDADGNIVSFWYGRGDHW
jgi:hypothetical protein